MKLKNQINQWKVYILTISQNGIKQNIIKKKYLNYN